MLLPSGFETIYDSNQATLLTPEALSTPAPIPAPRPTPAPYLTPVPLPTPATHTTKPPPTPVIPLELPPVSRKSRRIQQTAFIPPAPSFSEPDQVYIPLPSEEIANKGRGKGRGQKRLPKIRFC